MLVTFTTDAYPNITMFGDQALAMIKMMGHSETVPGAISAEDIPEALQKLTIAINECKIESPAKFNRTEEGEQEVPLAYRAMPLMNLLSAAVKGGGYVMWDKSTSLS